MRKILLHVLMEVNCFSPISILFLENSIFSTAIPSKRAAESGPRLKRSRFAKQGICDSQMIRAQKTGTLRFPFQTVDKAHVLQVKTWAFSMQRNWKQKQKALASLFIF